MHGATNEYVRDKQLEDLRLQEYTGDAEDFHLLRYHPGPMLAVLLLLVLIIHRRDKMASENVLMSRQGIGLIAEIMPLDVRHQPRASKVLCP